MSRQHIDHKDLRDFAAKRVNLPTDKANRLRLQAKRLRDKLDTYIAEHPDFELRKMRLSGSLAKGTALRSLNDIDVACYISGIDLQLDPSQVASFLEEKLRRAFPNFSPDQVEKQNFSVKVSFSGTGLDIDVVPILYFGDQNWQGFLVNRDDGTLLETNILRHLEFIRKRKLVQENHFAQVVRLVKFWANLQKQKDKNFRFKSFMIEMILSFLCDEQTDFSDYPEALQAFFTFIARSNMRESIVFTDYYEAHEVPPFSEAIKIIDPVNPENNVGRSYSDNEADAIVEAALEAGDAIDAALTATTKSQTIYYWRKIFGSSFNTGV